MIMCVKSIKKTRHLHEVFYFEKKLSSSEPFLYHLVSLLSEKRFQTVSFMLWNIWKTTICCLTCYFSNRMEIIKISTFATLVGIYWLIKVQIVNCNFIVKHIHWVRQSSTLNLKHMTHNRVTLHETIIGMSASYSHLL